MFAPRFTSKLRTDPIMLFGYTRRDEQIFTAVFLLGWAMVHGGRHLKIPLFSMYDDVRELKCPVNGILCSCYSGVLLFMALGVPCAGLIGAATFLYALTGQYAFCTCKLSMIKADTLTKVIPLCLCVHLETAESYWDDL